MIYNLLITGPYHSASYSYDPDAEKLTRHFMNVNVKPENNPPLFERLKVQISADKRDSLGLSYDTRVEFWDVLAGNEYEIRLAMAGIKDPDTQEPFLLLQAAGIFEILERYAVDNETNLAITYLVNPPRNAYTRMKDVYVQTRKVQRSLVADMVNYTVEGDKLKCYTFATKEVDL